MYLRDVIEQQRALQGRMGWPMGHGVEGYANNMLAMSVELYEALQELDWKPWKTDPADAEALVTELTDALQFWANATIELGLEASVPAAEPVVRPPETLDPGDVAARPPTKAQSLTAAHGLARVATAAQQAGDAARNEGLTRASARAHRRVGLAWSWRVACLGFAANDAEDALRRKWRENHARLDHD